MIRLIIYILVSLMILALFLFVPAALAASAWVVIVETYHTMKWIP